MGRNGAESTSSKTTSVNINAMLDHIVGRNAFALVFGMRLTRIRQIKGSIEFFSGHWRIGGIDDNITTINALQQTGGMHHV